MKPCYEGLKEIMELMSMKYEEKCWVWVSIGLLPLILIIMQNKTLYEGLKEIGVDVKDMKENVVF